MSRAHIAALAAALSLQGCAALVPNTVSPEFEHMSHAIQHQPVTSSPTNYGANIAQVTAEWDLSKRVYIALSEGVDLDKHQSGRNPTCGEIEGPREEFTARIGYRFVLKGAP